MVPSRMFRTRHSQKQRPEKFHTVTAALHNGAMIISIVLMAYMIAILSRGIIIKIHGILKGGSVLLVPFTVSLQ